MLAQDTVPQSQLKSTALTLPSHLLQLFQGIEYLQFVWELSWNLLLIRCLNRPDCLLSMWMSTAPSWDAWTPPRGSKSSVFLRLGGANTGNSSSATRRPMFSEARTTTPPNPTNPPPPSVTSENSLWKLWTECPKRMITICAIRPLLLL